MNKQTFISLITLVFISCHSATQEKVINTTKPPNELTIVQNKNDYVYAPQLLLTHSGSAQPSRSVIIKSINFTIVEKNNDTSHWSTSDPNFVTPEGYKVGTNWKEISSEYKKSIASMPGWGYYIKLNSEWQLGFCEGSSCTDNPPNDTSNVKWIFKRNE